MTAEDICPKWFQPFADKFNWIESQLDALVRRQYSKEWYTTEEVARILGKAPFTVREWCRHRRVNGRKQQHQRGRHPSWVISHDELLRIQRDGLLPLPATSTRI
jgi:hypothetical protein